MIRILLLVGFIFYSLPSLAKIVYAKASFMHGEEISTKDGCKFAREKAELEAIQKGIGVTISSENLKKCSQTDEKSNCEYNQFSLITFNGILTEVKELSKKKRTEPLDSGDIAYICEIEIKANAEPIKQIADPNFNFNVKLNESNFKSGDKLSMEIGLTKPMYLTIFQFLPYEKEGNQVSKLFPNEREEDNFIKSKKITLPYNAKYEIYFPEQVNKKNVDEYLFFIASDENIGWLDEYNNIYELKSSYIDSTKRVKTKYKQYTIYK
jgi:hypothetical protein